MAVNDPALLDHRGPRARPAEEWRGGARGARRGRPRAPIPPAIPNYAERAFDTRTPAEEGGLRRASVSPLQARQMIDSSTAPNIGAELRDFRLYGARVTRATLDRVELASPSRAHAQPCCRRGRTGPTQASRLISRGRALSATPHRRDSPSRENPWRPAWLPKAQ